MLFIQAPEPMMSDSYGRSICVVSDVDADTVSDFAIADGHWNSGAVVVDMRSGKSRRRIWRTSIQNGDVDCVFLVAASDMTGDGRPEVVLSLYNTSRVLVLDGANGLVVREFTSPGDYYGTTVCTGDFDRDGRGDVAIASLRSQVRVCSGRDGRLLHEIVLPGEYVLALASGFDFNRDGTPDISIFTSDPQPSRFDPARCRVRIRSGTNGEELKSFPWRNTTKQDVRLELSPNLPRLLVFENDHVTETDGNERVARERAHMAVFAPDKDGNARFRLPIEDGVSFQAVLSIVGDLDQDGVDDFVRGAHESGDFFNGEVTAYSGATWKPIWKRSGPMDSDLGASVAAGIDFNRDNVPDVITGSVHLRGSSHNGKVQGLCGKTGKTLWDLTRTSP